MAVPSPRVTERPSGVLPERRDQARTRSVLAAEPASAPVPGGTTFFDLYGEPTSDDLPQTGQVCARVAYVKRERLTQRERRWVNELSRRLWPETESLSEANYDYRIGARNYYVRVPWQVYLLFCALIAQPTTRFLSGRRQRQILAIFAALATSGGFVYPLSGSTPSTRTYAVLYDFFDEACSAFVRIPRLRVSSRMINTGFRLLYRRSVGLVFGVGSVGFICTAVYLWLDSGNASLADVAANFVAAAVLALLGGARRQWRR